MKKNWTTRVAIALLALTMITSCFVGSTFAKYVSKAEGEATARVAKWGIVMEIENPDAEIFKLQYATDDQDAIEFVGPYSVVSQREDEVVAPGTLGDSITVNIAGCPEVAFALCLDVTKVEDIVLPAGEYTDYSTTLLDGTHPTFVLGEDYHPIQYTLAIDIPAIGTRTKTGTIDEIIEALNNFANNLGGDDDLTAMFPAGTDLEGSVTLSWEWPFEQGDEILDDEGNGTGIYEFDAADTFLGNWAAVEFFGQEIEGFEAPENGNIELVVNLTATAVQID